MALRLFLSLQSKRLLPRVAQRLTQKLSVTTVNDVNTVDTLKESKDEEGATENSENYFRSLFYETHPALEEGKIKMKTGIDETKSKAERKSAGANFHIDSDRASVKRTGFDETESKFEAEHNSAGANFHIDSEGTSVNDAVVPLIPTDDRMATNWQDPYPKDVVNTPLDPEVLEDIGPPLPKSFNLAAFADKSETIQQFINLGVNLFLVERQGFGQYYLDLDFERDVKNHLVFLNDVGVDAESLGTYITRNPGIFQEDLDDLRVRVEYLKSKKFRNEPIARIVTKAPLWLNHSTKAIDSKLGFLQRFFSLSGNEIRFLIAKKPKIALSNFQRLSENHFLIKEQMGFTKEESKKMLLEKPKIWLLSPTNLWQRFDYIHNKLKIPHSLILLQPDSLLQRKFKIEERHLYLEKLGRAQYDPTKEGYVSLSTLAFAKEDAFCEDTCKTSVDDFNNFLKEL